MMTGDKLELSEMLNLLQSNDCNVEEIKTMIHDHLKQSKDASQLNLVVDYYVSTGHARLQEILIGIREPHDKHLFDKLNDCLKKRVQLKALTLLGYVIHRQPTWLHNISHHAVLPTIIKMLNTDLDVQNLMCGVLILVTLLPVIPSLVGPFLEDMFASFTRLASFHTRKPPNIPEVHVMHLHVATYTLFHRLYSLYPCHFIGYLRTYFSSRDRLVNFADTIRPMLERVRLHPDLIISAKTQELSLNRWRSMETQDIVMECAKVSLDPNEGLREEQVTVGLLNTALQKLKHSYKADLGPIQLSVPGRLPFIPVSRDSILGQELVPGWSPSYACGLNTPPPSQQNSPPGGYLGAEYLATFSPSTETLKVSVLDLGASAMLEKATERTKEQVIERRKGVEREDSVVDTEVASLTGQPMDVRLVQRSPSVRGSGQWSQSPYLELVQQQDSHRGRSFSQGKRGPRRAPRRPSMHGNRSHSLPDLRRDLQHEWCGDRWQVVAPAVAAPVELSTADDSECILDASEEALAPLPFQQLFEMAMSDAPNRAAGEKPVAEHAPLFVQMSPPELLDRYLVRCGEMHRVRAMEESEVSESGTGAASASWSSGQQSEIEILRGQIQLLHTQLLYERHKREMHAERNRRLLGKAKRAKALDEQSRTLENQVAFLGSEIATLIATSADVRRERQETVDAKNTELVAAHEALSRVTKQNTTLIRDNEELTFKLDETTNELRTLQKDLHKVQSDLFGTHHELEVIQEQVLINGHLRSEIEKLNKELILVIELNQRYRERDNLLPERHQHEAELEQLRQTALHETRTLRTAMETRDAVVTSCRARIAELESALHKRDVTTAQQKRLLKGAKDEYHEQVQAVERKYQTRGMICRHLEEEVLRLQHRIHRMEAACRSRLINEAQRERELAKRGSNARIPPRDLTSPELAVLVPGHGEDQISYFDDVADECRSRVRERLPTGTVRRASQPIDIDLNNPVSRARRLSASKTKKGNDGGGGDDDDGTAVGAAASERSPAEMDFYGGFGGLSESALEDRRLFLRRGNEPSVLETITSLNLASLIDQLEGENSCDRSECPT